MENADNNQFNNIKKELHENLSKIAEIKELFNNQQLKSKINKNIFNTEAVKTRINYNIQILYSAAFFNLLYKNGENVFKTHCENKENQPETFEIKAILKLHNKDFEISNQYEMIYWNFFIVKENNSYKAERAELDNNKILFKLMDYIRKTR